MKSFRDGFIWVKHDTKNWGQKKVESSAMLSGLKNKRYSQRGWFGELWYWYVCKKNPWLFSSGRMPVRGGIKP